MVVPWSIRGERYRFSKITSSHLKEPVIIYRLGEGEGFWGECDIYGVKLFGMASFRYYGNSEPGEMYPI